ncbi:MAG: zinc-ribbon and DUF3426 domain-containing protein [Gammaproteobacteria bacterium]|nr:zinc-ribbon and DUF3426 domain-containing protein [Gammaproteobacteria bacterium]MDH5735442.1 zinc-ribbon and DUF3426 domain-containing protein [Gammaproteobacteria bacterium]
MNTQCPHCHTIFKIHQQQIKQAEGQVRCGHCLAIFSAEILIDDPVINESQQNNVEHNHFKLNDIPSITMDRQQPNGLPDVVPPELRAEIRSRKKHYSVLSSIFWSLAIITMIAAGIAQYAYYDRTKLVQHNELRPWLEMLCLYAKCELPEPRDPSRIELTHKNVFTHPNQAGALMISATIVNQAEFKQAFPLLDIVFSNVRGEHIAGRRFKPEEYLHISADQLGKMEPGEPISFNIEIIDSGKELMSYEFNFL